MVESPRAIFISWVPFQARSDGIARALGIPAWFSDGGGRGPHGLRDIRRWGQTRRLLKAERPDVLIIMQPPVMVLWCVWRFARKTGARIAGDLHTGVFTEPGNRLAMRHTLRLLRRTGLAIVTNQALREVVESHGCPALILHDLVEVRERDMSRPANPVLADLIDGTFALVPLAYSFDEPIDQLIAAARTTPDLRWVFTGRAPRKVRTHAPPNVSFPGYVSNEDYARALSRAGVVVAMTTREHTMQSAAYEALSYARPLVTADAEVLSAYYGGAAQIVAPRAGEIAEGVRRALADETASERMAELRSLKIAEQHHALAALRDWMVSG